MTFPTISYKYNSVEEADALATLMDQKLAPLGMFIPDDVDARCSVEFERESTQQHGKVYRVETNLTIDGVLHRAEATEDSFELAIDEVRDEINKKLRRAKSKNTSLFRRAGRKMKEKFMKPKY